DTLDRITGLNNFAQATSLLDLGAGPGLFGMAVAKARPDMRVSLLDRPQVVWHARSVARRRGMEDKLHFLEGDMFQGGLSGQYDIIFASDCLYAARNQLAEFFCTLKDHLTPGGAVVLRHVETTHDATAPRANALLNLGAELIGFGEYMFTTGDIPKALRAAGFSLISSAPQEHVTHLYTIHTAYK
ncbi:MAG: class I SAM-dependent methyltransferase, partial [Desulfovibrionaceae bacterium]